MRTEEPFQQLGLASALLATGLDRLANRGCSRMKVTYLLDNRASIRLYLGAGFIRTSSSEGKLRVSQFESHGSTSDLVHIAGATQSLEESWADSSATLVESSLASGEGYEV